MLSEEQRQELREIILKEIETLESTQAGLAEGAKPVALDGSMGRVNRMGAMLQQGTSEHLQGHTIQRLKQMRTRLRDIDSISYGVCGRCGGDIEIDRLKAVPDASICMGCARMLNPGAR